MSVAAVNLRWVTTSLDHKRIPRNASERGEKQGDIPYWGANGIVDYVDDYLVNEPVVLIGEDGAPFLDPLQEVAFQVDGPIWPNNHIHILRPNREKLTDGFLKHWLNTVPYAIYINGSTRDKLTQAQLGSIKIDVPPLEIQNRIAAFLDKKTAQIDALVEKKRALLDRLAEKRQAIITQAVTKGLDPAASMKNSSIDWLGQIPAHWEAAALGHRYQVQLGRMLNGRVEERRGAVEQSVSPPPLIKPDVRISRIRLSDWLHGRLTSGRRSGGSGAASAHQACRTLLPS